MSSLAAPSLRRSRAPISASLNFALYFKSIACRALGAERLQALGQTGQQLIVFVGLCPGLLIELQAHFGPGDFSATFDLSRVLIQQIAGDANQPRADHGGAIEACLRA